MVILTESKTSPRSRLRLSEHCLKRYHQRFAYSYDFLKASANLEKLARENGVVTDKPPQWLLETAQQQAELYLVIGDDMVLPLEKDRYKENCYIAKTCLGRGNISDKARQRRNAKAKNKRQRKHSH